MDGDDTNYGKLVEDLGVWTLTPNADIQEKIRVREKYLHNVFDPFPLVSWPSVMTTFCLLPEQNDLVNNMDVLKELLRMKKDSNQLETAACREGWSEAEISDANRIYHSLRESFFQLVQRSNLQNGAKIERRKRGQWENNCMMLYHIICCVE